MARFISHLAFILAYLLCTVSAYYEYPEPENSLKLLPSGSYGNKELTATAEAKRTESVSSGITVQPAVFQGGRITLGRGGSTNSGVSGGSRVSGTGLRLRGSGGAGGTIIRESVSTGLGSSNRLSGGRIGGTNTVVGGGRTRVAAQTTIGSSVSTTLGGSNLLTGARVGGTIIRGSNTVTGGGVGGTITGGTVSGGSGLGRGISRPSNDVSYLNPDPIARLATAIPRGGVPGRDYPILSSVPETGFSCNGLISGYYADTDQEARCQVYHTCNAGKQNDFLCPNGTIFNQQFFVCDWWYNVDCGSADLFFGRNAEIGNPNSKSIANDNIGLPSTPQKSVSIPSRAVGKTLSKTIAQVPQNYEVRGNSNSKTVSSTLTENSSIRNRNSNSKTSGYLTENSSIRGRNSNNRGRVKYRDNAGVKRIYGYNYNANGLKVRPTAATSYPELSDTLVVPLERLLIL